MRKMGVIDLIAIAASLIFLLGMVPPTFYQSRELVHRAKCASNLKRLGTAWAMYLNDYGGFMPAFGGVMQFGWGVGPGWMDKLFPYVYPHEVKKGPFYPESANTKSTEVFRCPSLQYSPAGRKYLSGYILNSRLYLDSATGGWQNMSEVVNRDKLIVLYDRNKWTGAEDDADMTDEWGNSGADGYGPGGLWYYYSGGPDFSGPHAGGYNILFADWHVKWFGKWASKYMTRHAEY